MPTKKNIFLASVLIFLNLFWGCAGLEKEPVKKTYFDLSIPAPDSDLSGKMAKETDNEMDNSPRGEPILIKEFSINSAFDSHAFVYYTGKDRYTTDFFNEFITYPARLITEKISGYLFSTACFTPAFTGVQQEVNFRLSGKIIRLYADFQDPDHPKAVVEVRMILEKRTLETGTGNTYQVILNKAYPAQEPMSSSQPAQLVAGWNKGLARIMAAFVRDFQALTP